MRNPILILFFLVPVLCYSQVIHTDYRDKDDEKCSESEAFYILEYSIHSEETGKFIKTKKTVNGHLLEKAELSDVRPDIRDGESIAFFEENGKTKSFGNYIKNKQSGIWKYYYRNGQVKEEIDFDIPDEKDVKYRVWQAYDSLGNRIIFDGEGLHTEDLIGTVYGVWADGEKKDGEIMGELKNGYKHGIWKGQFFESGDSLEESWKMGKLIKGKRMERAGQVFEYDELFVRPEPDEGITTFYQFISKTLRYPDKARKKGVEGKVFVQFVVETNGQLDKIKVVKGIGVGCDKEVLRVMKLAPDWNAGYYRGKAVKVKMILPITFKLT